MSSWLTLRILPSDLGGSGGTFGGLYGGVDDANVMSFDGLFVRGEVAY